MLELSSLTCVSAQLALDPLHLLRAFAFDELSPVTFKFGLSFGKRAFVLRNFCTKICQGTGLEACTGTTIAPSTAALGLVLRCSGGGQTVILATAALGRQTNRYKPKITVTNRK